MTNPVPHLETAVELARLRTQMETASEGVKRIEDTLLRNLRDMESRLRTVEAMAMAITPLQDTLKAQAEALRGTTARVTELETNSHRENGARRALWALATLPTTGLLVAIAKGWL